MADDEDVSGQEGQEGSDEVFVEGFDDDYTEESTDEKKKKDTKQAEAKSDEVVVGRLSELENAVARLQEDKRNLNKALHEERKAKKEKGGGDTEDVKLSDAELTKLLEEYKDDPATMKNIMRYIAKEAAQGAKKEVIDEATNAAKRKEVDTFLRNDLPELYREGGQLREVADDIKKHYGLDDHPMGDLFAIGAHMVMNRKALLRAAFDAGMKAAQNDRGESARKEVIKGNELLKGGKKIPGHEEMSSSHRDVAKRLGISDKRPGETDAAYNRRMTIFKNIVGKPGAAVTVEG